MLRGPYIDHNKYLVSQNLDMPGGFLNEPSPASFSFIFGPFKQTSIQLYSKLMSIQYMVLDSNPQPSEREFSTITIRPGLPPNQGNLMLSFVFPLGSFEAVLIVHQDNINAIPFTLYSHFRQKKKGLGELCQRQLAIFQNQTPSKIPRIVIILHIDEIDQCLSYARLIHYRDQSFDTNYVELFVVVAKTRLQNEPAKCLIQ